MALGGVRMPARSYALQAMAPAFVAVVVGAMGWLPPGRLPIMARAACGQRRMVTITCADPPPPLLPRPPTPGSPLTRFQQLSVAFAGGFALALVLQFTSSVDRSALSNVQALDRQLDNPEVCLNYGAGAVVLDQRIFMSLNPLKIYVAPTSVKSGCVLRMSNWKLLEQRDLVTRDDVKDCKMAFNTFAFTGRLDAKDEKPEVSCVYESTDNALVDQAVDNARNAAAGFATRP